MSSQIVVIGALCVYMLALYSFWPLTLVAIALCVVYGRPTLALVLALGSDLLYGVPTGAVQSLLLPFTLATLVAVVVRSLVYVRMRHTVPNFL